MLHFWKKSGLKDKFNLASSPNKVVNGNALPVGVVLSHLPDSNCVGPLTNFQHVIGLDDKVPSDKSRLSLSLPEVLQDKTALSYFSQFMELRGFTTVLNLWFDIQKLSEGDIPESNCHGDKHEPSQDKLPAARSSSSDRSASDFYRTRRAGRVRCASDGGGRTGIMTLGKIWHLYMTDEATVRLRLPDELRTKFQNALSQGNHDQACIEQLKKFVFQTLHKELWNDFLRSEFYSKFQVDVMTSGTVTLSDIMYHTTALSFFVEFVEQEGCQRVIEFWQTATNFEQQLECASEAYDATQAQNDAILIYDKYLSLQATCPLGIDHATRCEVEQRICMETAEPRTDCFRPALSIAWAYLSIVCLPLFLSSQSYVQLLSELMRASRGTSSPASSVTDISVESRSRHDPDLIWRQRHHNRGLSIGRIDQLGRFEKDIEPEPDKKSESRISRVVKKLVNKEEDKAQEEMAWRIAEMIVKDVTNLTMGGQFDESDADEDT